MEKGKKNNQIFKANTVNHNMNTNNIINAPFEEIRSIVSTIPSNSFSFNPTINKNYQIMRNNTYNNQGKPVIRNCDLDYYQYKEKNNYLSNNPKYISNNNIITQVHSNSNNQNIISDKNIFRNKNVNFPSKIISNTINILNLEENQKIGIIPNDIIQPSIGNNIYLYSDKVSNTAVYPDEENENNINKILQDINSFGEFIKNELQKESALNIQNSENYITIENAIHLNYENSKNMEYKEGFFVLALLANALKFKGCNALIERYIPKNNEK